VEIENSSQQSVIRTLHVNSVFELLEVTIQVTEYYNTVESAKGNRIGLKSRVVRYIRGRIAVLDLAEGVK